MKTSKLFKITLSIALFVFMSANVFGQELNSGSGDPEDNLPVLNEDDDGTAVDHVTEGYIVPYYVTPDPVLNSGYTEPYVIGTADQGFGSSWGWGFNTNNDEDGGNPAGDANATIYNGGYDEDNTVEYGYDHPYVEVEWTRSTGATAGSGEQAYIEVREEGPSEITCTGEWNWLPVQVYAKPSFDFMDGNNGNVLNADGVIELCDDGTDGIDQDILIASITDNGIPIDADEPFENGIFKFRLDRDVYAVDASLEPLDPNNPVSESIDEVVEVEASFGNDILLLSETLSAVPDNEGTDQITRYRYDFGTTIDENTTTNTNNGITDPVQRKSQYLSDPDADWDYIANSDTEGEGDLLTFIVYPAPSTGNIHHVPNDFDL